MTLEYGLATSDMKYVLALRGTVEGADGCGDKRAGGWAWFNRSSTPQRCARCGPSVLTSKQTDHLGLTRTSLLHGQFCHDTETCRATHTHTHTHTLGGPLGLPSRVPPGCVEPAEAEILFRKRKKQKHFSFTTKEISTPLAFVSILQ